MADQRGSSDSSVPSNKPDTRGLSSSSSGPDGEYSKATRIRVMKVEPKLSAENYLTWAEKMWIQLKSMRVLKLVGGKIQPDQNFLTNGTTTIPTRYSRYGQTVPTVTSQLF